MPRWWIRMRTAAGAAVVVPLLMGLSACGGSDAPAKLEPVQPDVPENLCSLLPPTVVGKLETASNTDPSGNPTSSCSLSSAVEATPTVRAVVTITQYNDVASAKSVYESQCRALDAATATVTQDLPVPGADQACGAQQKDADVATLAAVQGNDVLTARSSSAPASNPSALARGTTMLEAVLSGASAAPSSAAPSS